MKYYKRYWWVPLLMLGLPLLLNCVLLIPSFTKIVGNETDWLSFWGGYLGAILSAMVAFYVLSKQLAQNQEQNSINREANKKENETNRELQIQIMEYQLGLNDLNQFKDACIKCQEAYSYNNLCEIANIARNDKNMAISKIKEYMECAAFAKRKVDIVNFENSHSAIQFRCLNCLLYQTYSETLADLQVLVSYLNFSDDNAITGLSGDIPASKHLKPIVSKHISDIRNKGVNKSIHEMIYERLDIFEPNAINKLWNVAFKYIQEETKKIKVNRQ